MISLCFPVELRLNRNFGTKLGKPGVVIETLRHPCDTSDILVTFFPGLLAPPLFRKDIQGASQKRCTSYCEDMITTSS